jgi:glycosyltransferase involved in cell wall biosynthesis
MPKFSVIIPVYSETDPLQSGSGGQRHFRGKTVQRAIKSVIAQQFPDWELILVNDGVADYPRDEDGEPIEGSEPTTLRVLNQFAAADDRIRVVSQNNSNRAIARNTGMDQAQGDWICWLDSDDEWSTHYLRELHQATLDFPEYKIFNFGSLIHFPDHHTATRDAFKPAIEGEGHEWFRSGHIGAGSFIFRRDLWDSDTKYRIPDEVNPYQFAAASGFDMRFPADQPDIDDPAGAFSDGVYRHGLSLGNPWGDDFLQFYLLTRDNHSKPLDVLLYIQYPRAHEEVYEHFGEIYDANV